MTSAHSLCCRAPKAKILKHVSHDHNAESEVVDRKMEVKQQAEYRAALDKQVRSRDGREERDRVNEIAQEKSHLVHVDADLEVRSAKPKVCSVEQKVKKLRKRAKNRRSSVTDIKEGLKKPSVEGDPQKQLVNPLDTTGKSFELTTRILRQLAKPLGRAVSRR